MNIRPLIVIFGAEWHEVDVLRLFDPDIKPRLLCVEERAQRVLLSQALNAVTRMLMPRYRTRGAYTLWDMYIRSRQHVPLVGVTARAYLDKLFETLEPVTAPQFEYPLVTLSGVMYHEPVDDCNAAEHCACCPHLAECHEIVVQRDGFALCENVLSSELMMDVQYAE